MLYHVRVQFLPNRENRVRSLEITVHKFCIGYIKTIVVYCKNYTEHINTSYHSVDKMNSDSLAPTFRKGTLPLSSRLKLQLIIQWG